MIQYEFGTGGHERQLPVEQCLHEHTIQSRQEGVFPVLFEVAAARGDGLVDLLVGEIFVEYADWNRFPGVPVFVEAVRYIIDHGTDRDEVLVEELAGTTGLVVLVCQVTAADDRDLIVDRERLVMHAPIENIEIGDEADQPGTTARKRIEDTNFDFHVVIETQQATVYGLRQRIVHQQPDANTTVGSLDELQGDQIATEVVANQVTLDVDTAFCALDQSNTHAQGIDA